MNRPRLRKKKNWQTKPKPGSPTRLLLLSHPLVGPNLRVLGEIAAEHPNQRVSVLVEEPTVVLEVPEDLGGKVELTGHG